MTPIYLFIKEWLYQASLGLDNFTNALVFFGSADESISGRCFRLNHITAYRVAEVGVNTLFYLFQGADHCKHAYIKDVLGRQLPKHFYDKAIAMGLQIDPNKLGPNIVMPQ